jgi:hypothetical protein
MRVFVVTISNNEVLTVFKSKHAAEKYIKEQQAILAGQNYSIYETILLN